jgi:hypothetical protein
VCVDAGLLCAAFIASRPQRDKASSTKVGAIPDRGLEPADDAQTQTEAGLLVGTIP